MQFDPLRAQNSVDAKTAQEALALAIRLQQEKGERVTMDELHRISVEAGIDPVYLDSALHQLTYRAPAITARVLPQKQVVPIVVALVFLMYSMVVLNWGHDRGEWTEAAAMVFVAAAIGARILVPRRRRGLISRLLQRQD